MSIKGTVLTQKASSRSLNWTCLYCQHIRWFQRFSTSPRARQEQLQHESSFKTRLRASLRNTKIQWSYRIPVILGICSLGALQFYKVQRGEQERHQEEQHDLESIKDNEGRPRRRERIRPSGPWQVQVMSTLPLKAVSRLWGRFNELEIPYYLRVPGFRLYSWIFGVNLSEAAESDLHQYKNLASFFYRTLRPGVRPIDNDPSALLSPADGRILQYGTIENGEVGQVKGMTYSLEALLGTQSSGRSKAEKIPELKDSSVKPGDEDIVKDDEEFAIVNGISYTLPTLISGSELQGVSRATDMSMTSRGSSEKEVQADLALGDGSSRSWLSSAIKTPTALYYIVIYLAPGDYHRFHSPASWVAEKRRHFAGELYSVSPYLQRKLPGLFTLNERVVLLGRWRWGFFSFTPVGATNVGSIKINFDRELRTNKLTTDTAADRAAAEAANRGERYTGFTEATYGGASKTLGGHALRKGEEMGGFQLGSSIVLVFEAPKGRRQSFDEGWTEGPRQGGWQWAIKPEQQVNYGEAIGWVET